MEKKRLIVSHLLRSDTCGDAVLLGTADVLQALLGDGRTALEIMPVQRHGNMEQHDDSQACRGSLWEACFRTWLEHGL